MSRSRLRIGVPPLPASLPNTTSVGRIWHNTLERLSNRADVVVRDPYRDGWRRRSRVDVWLTDGHQGPLDVDRPVVAHFHEATWSHPDLRPLLAPSFVAAYEVPSADAAERAASILTVSYSSRDQILAAYNVEPDRVHVAYNGVDHSVYRPGLSGAKGLITQAGGIGAIPYVLFVSTVHPRKNLDALREAMARLARRGSQHALVLVAGPAADRPSETLLREATAPIDGVSAPVVNLAGASDREVAMLMASAAAFCQPSLMEGFGMAVAEAMACGAPVVASDRGSLPEVVADAGVIVEPTASDIEEALIGIVGDPARAAELRHRAIARASRFTWEATAAGWWQAVQAAIG